MSTRPDRTHPVPVFYDELADPETVQILTTELGPGFELYALTRDDRQEELALARRATFILAGWRPIPADVINAASGLMGIHKLGSGLEKIDLEQAARRHVTVSASAGLNADQVAEHTVLLLLAALRRLPALDRSIREGRWLKNELRPRLHRLAGRRVGILGMGRIGRAVAARLAAFRCEIAYYDVNRLAGTDENEFDLAFAELVPMIAWCDVLTMHVPSVPATRGMLDRERLESLPRGAVVVNTARGDVLDEAALVDLLRSGHLSAAGLDVYAHEPPPPDHPLFGLDNVVLTPHVGGSSREGVHDLGEEARNILERVLAGEVPQQAVVAPRSPRDATWRTHV